MFFCRNKAFQSSLKEDLDFHDRFAVLKRDDTAPNRRQETLFERSKGFSKVELQDDTGEDTKIYLALRRNKTLPAISNTGENVKPSKRCHITDADVYVLYPTPENKIRGRTIISVAELKNWAPNNMQRRSLVPAKTYKNVNNRQDSIRPNTVHEIRLSRLPKPSYVSQLESIADDEYDPYTDGTMNLEERKFHQRRKEFMPTELGHLPVRRRKNCQKSREGSYQLKLANNKFTGLPAKNIKIYVPKSVQLERAAKDHEDSKSFLRIKQEHQATQYAKVLSSTAGFLGGEPQSKQLIQFPNLNSREKVMLGHVEKKLNSFKAAATVVKWLTTSLRKVSKSNNSQVPISK